VSRLRAENKEVRIRCVWDAPSYFLFPCEMNDESVPLKKAKEKGSRIPTACSFIIHHFLLIDNDFVETNINRYSFQQSHSYSPFPSGEGAGGV
jgi:hypothetical protein